MKKYFFESFIIFLFAVFLVSCKKTNKTTKNTTNGNDTIVTSTTADPNHVHVFDVKNTDEKYLATPASCLKAATYYYACTCGEKGSETYTPDDAKPLGHHINAIGICTNEGCDVNYNYDVKDLTSESFTSIPVTDGYAYIHLPEECCWYHTHLESESFLFDDFEAYLGSDLSNITNEFTVSEPTANHLMCSKTLYGDIYLKIAAKDQTAIDIRFNTSSVREEHFFPTLANITYVDGGFAKTCVYCEKELTDAVKPVDVPSNGGDFKLTGTVENPNMYVYKISTSSVKLVLVDSFYPYNAYQVKDGKTIDANYIIDSDTYLVFDGISADENISIALADPTDLPEDGSISFGGDYEKLYKVKKPTDGKTYIGNIDSDSFSFYMYDSYDLEYVNSTDNVKGEYVYIDITATDESVTSAKFSFIEHTHVFDEEGYCECGECNYDYIYGEEERRVIVGEYKLYYIADAGKVTLSSKYDASMEIKVYLSEGDTLVASGTGSVTFTALDDTDYYVVFTNTSAANRIVSKIEKVTE